MFAQLSWYVCKGFCSFDFSSYLPHLLYLFQMDCCHSGTALDLPYEMNATDTSMHANDGFNMNFLQDPATLACLACCAFCLLDDIIAMFL